MGHLPKSLGSILGDDPSRADKASAARPISMSEEWRCNRPKPACWLAGWLPYEMMEGSLSRKQ
jgi:hypothetical protein